MVCPSCDSENFGAQARGTEVVRACQDCGYAEAASAGERADVMGEEIDRSGAPIEEDV